MADRYVVERILGRGGMATVYLAHDTLLDRPVVLKVLAEHLAHDGSFRERFQREARLAARLVHPNIVQIYDVGEDARGPFIVMEYVDGDTLADELARRGRLPAAEVVAIGTQLCAALEAAHAAHLVHRDIKPQNVLRTRDGKVKLADFGIARSLAMTSHTEAGTVLGTAAYLAPEQGRGEEVTAAADIYSLGVVLYELLTGQTPFDGADTLPQLVLQREQGLVTPPRELVPEIPATLEAVVMRCLALRPEYRPASAAALAAELKPSRVTRATAVLPVAPRRRSRRPVVVVGGAVLLAAAVLAIVLATSGTTPKAAATTTVAPKTTPATAPSTTAPATTAAATQQLPSPATTAQAIADARAAILTAQTNGQLSPGAAEELVSRLDDIGQALGRPNGNDAANKLGDLRQALAGLVDDEQLSSAGLASISAPLDRLASLLPAGKQHGHHKHGGDS